MTDLRCVILLLIALCCGHVIADSAKNHSQNHQNRSLSEIVEVARQDCDFLRDFERLLEYLLYLEERVYVKRSYVIYCRKKILEARGYGIRTNFTRLENAVSDAEKQFQIASGAWAKAQKSVEGAYISAANLRFALRLQYQDNLWWCGFVHTDASIGFDDAEVERIFEAFEDGQKRYMRRHGALALREVNTNFHDMLSLALCAKQYVKDGGLATDDLKRAVELVYPLETNKRILEEKKSTACVMGKRYGQMYIIFAALRLVAKRVGARASEVQLGMRTSNTTVEWHSHVNVVLTYFKLAFGGVAKAINGAERAMTDIFESVSELRNGFNGYFVEEVDFDHELVRCFKSAGSDPLMTSSEVVKAIRGNITRLDIWRSHTEASWALNSKEDLVFFRSCIFWGGVVRQFMLDRFNTLVLRIRGELGNVETALREAVGWLKTAQELLGGRGLGDGHIHDANTRSVNNKTIANDSIGHIKLANKHTQVTADMILSLDDGEMKKEILNITEQLNIIGSEIYESGEFKSTAMTLIGSRITFCVVAFAAIAMGVVWRRASITDDRTPLEYTEGRRYSLLSDLPSLVTEDSFVNTITAFDDCSDVDY
ncbi:hypothetical protein ERJ75_000740400 [Trypanosoma vivax]|uniref:Uncharacterized protein n=1 Tax=Trypanosoma vivax (strain Y486) TaxID=1055687 RepID=F9WQB2_TRYVY|nr:hypothetical protein ERJ75_000740400 [Trypanosoma vivax]CCD19739.1 hypothetical protein, conserved in T. vivax [Trypanosoma vivax Y486]|eukprot:CCD19739.1 hypothetical protein, conserved in T. vivax [Trypanosoma vivax Y486]